MKIAILAAALTVCWMLQLASCQQCRRVAFTPSVLRDCVSDAWQLRDNSSDDKTCAMKCARLARCRAFTMDGGCRLFVFDACSRGLVRSAAACNNRSSLIYVRQVSGVPPGRVCPSSFAFRGSVGSFNGSLYRQTSEPVTWANGSLECGDGGAGGGVPAMMAELDGGLAEVTSIQNSIGLIQGVGFWVGARLTAGSWQWATCGTAIPVSSNIWFPGEPNNIPVGGDKARMKSDGLADNLSNAFFTAVCECLDPFFQR